MTEQELREKIADTLNATEISVELEKRDIYKFADALIAAEIGDLNELQKECDSKEEAYNKCYNDYRYWKDKAKEYKHRAEVAERDMQAWKDCAQSWQRYFHEKELQEEGKMSKKHMLFSEKEKLEKEYLQWCEKANKEIHGGRIDDKSFITVISFLQSIGWGNIKELESENAELRARLDNAVELPCKVGDSVWKIVDKKHIFGYLVRSFLITETKILIELENKKRYKEGYIDINELGKCWFLKNQKEAAESRLAELKGEQK